MSFSNDKLENFCFKSTPLRYQRLILGRAGRRALRITLSVGALTSGILTFGFERILWRINSEIKGLPFELGRALPCKKALGKTARCWGSSLFLQRLGDGLRHWRSCLIQHRNVKFYRFTYLGPHLLGGNSHPGLTPGCSPPFPGPRWSPSPYLKGKTRSE
ncbi:hypothetical protein TNIN_405411 [Trichonephila inaurata madagascariensis]|uniref:Uncharacterized protein n=1 Tax=Trichonephila inaurata madagascariensis TaxID=2747483 RepID=A0A8X6YN40_9ARAC|nr:hypothetical protein TNIN_405411 [Trichonephila inaurata madagascariensis]